VEHGTGNAGIHFLSLRVPNDLDDTPTAVLQWAWESRVANNNNDAGFLGCADIEISSTKEPCGVYVDGPLDEGTYEDRNSGYAHTQSAVVCGV